MCVIFFLIYVNFSVCLASVYLDFSEHHLLPDLDDLQIFRSSTFYCQHIFKPYFPFSFNGYVWGFFEICYFCQQYSKHFLCKLCVQHNVLVITKIFTNLGKKYTFNAQEKISHKKRIMEIVPCTVDQEVKERKKNADFVLSLI